MRSTIHSRRWLDKPLHGNGARVLLVIKNPEDLSYYGAILQKLRCQVRSSSSFTEGAQFILRDTYDLIILDQGSSRFEARQLLMTAMEVDTEVPVLVLARSYHRGCYADAMQSGALDYLEGLLSKEEIVAFIETFVPPRAGFRRSSGSPSSGSVLGKKHEIKATSNHLHLANGARVSFGEHLQL